MELVNLDWLTVGRCSGMLVGRNVISVDSSISGSVTGEVNVVVLLTRQVQIVEKDSGHLESVSTGIKSQDGNIISWDYHTSEEMG